MQTSHSNPSGEGAAPTVERGRFSAPPDQAAVARDWSARGFSCQLWVDPPGQAWNDFVHGTRELVTVLEGQLEFSVGGATLVLEPGDELSIPRDALHSVKNIHSRTSRWLFGYDGQARWLNTGVRHSG